MRVFYCLHFLKIKMSCNSRLFLQYVKVGYYQELQADIMQKNAALIVVDVQNGFTSGGNLAVAHAEQIIPLINQLIEKFENVILTQDWHPKNHISFAENHANKKAYDFVQADYGTQVLWPTHCVQGTVDADFHPDLNTTTAQLILRKGINPQIDSYSAFMEADHKTTTGLAGYLKERKIDTVYIVGIATDFCVAWSAMDAAKLGFETYVISDATKAIDLQGTLQHAWQEMLAVGVKRVVAKQILNTEKSI